MYDLQRPRGKAGLAFSGELCYNRGVVEYSNIPAVRSLCALVAAHGIRCCVLCPGSRNSPIVRTLEAMEGMECRELTDERSAGFAALGWSSRVREPVLLCVTSGSALLNAHPAVAEAAYRKLPLLVVSADRPEEWIGQQDGQTLPQPGVYGGLVRYSCQLPVADGREERLHRNRLINEALLELRRHGGGPVHINIPLREPLFGTNDSPLQRERVIRRTETATMRREDEEELLNIVARLPRRLILLGQLPEAPTMPPELIEKGFALAGEHLSNTASLTQTRPDAVPGAESPQLLITMGGCLVSKRLKNMLRQNPPEEHWHVSRDGACPDTFGCLTRCIEGDPTELWDLLAAFAEPGDTAYAAAWQRTVPPPQLPYCGPAIVGAAMAALPPNSVLHLANSSAVRYAQLFPLPPGTHTECNRGVNGIEGSLSAALGYAEGDERLNLLIIGDLSFFYDMNALWQAKPSGNMRILLLNNGGGGIFDTLPGLQPTPAICGRNPRSAEAWARCCGWHYLPVRGERDLPAAVAALTSPDSPAPVLVEAFTDSKQDARILRQI